MIVIYFVFLTPKAPPPSEVQEEKAQTQSQSTNKEAAEELEVVTDEAELLGANSEIAGRLFTLSNERMEVQLNGLAQILSLDLPQFQESPDPESTEIVSYDFKKGTGFNDLKLETSAGPVVWELKSATDTELVFVSENQYVEIQRRLSLGENTYTLDVKDSIRNKSSKSVRADLSLNLVKELDPEKQSGFFEKLFSPQADFQHYVWFEDGSLETALLEEFDNEPTRATEFINWAGFSTKYFFLGVVPKNTSIIQLDMITEKSELRAEQTIELNRKQIEPNSSSSYDYSFYLGPKQIPELKKVSEDLDRVVEYGNWIGPISRLLLSLMLFFYDVFPNYGVAIILLTVVVKAVLFPLAYKGGIGMRKMALLQPKIKEIRDKYKSNPQRMQAETMNLYRTEKFNPLGGCLPLLLQMPVFFALYRVFFASFEMRHAPFVGWIQDLSAADPYFVTPVLMSILMYFQFKITPQPTMGEENEAVKIQRTMMKWMPFMFGFFMLFLPAGLTIYMLVNAVISIIQQHFLNKHLNKKYPLPTAKPKLEVKTANGG